MKFFYDGKNTWPDRGLEIEKYNELRRRGKAADQLHEIKLQNGLTKWILGFFLFMLLRSARVHLNSSHNGDVCCRIKSYRNTFFSDTAPLGG